MTTRIGGRKLLNIRHDQLVARPLPKHRTTQTQNKRMHTPNIHALSGIRPQDPSVRASEDISCLKPRGYCHRPVLACKYIVHYTERAHHINKSATV
jgi:hypothetical protein